MNVKLPENIMKTEPNLKDWAEAIMYGITGCEKHEKRTLEWLENELNDIAAKYYQLGFEDGDKDGWHTALEQDVEQQRKWTEQEDLSQLGTQDIKIEGKQWIKFK